MKIELVQRDMNEIREIIKKSSSNQTSVTSLLWNLSKKGFRINHQGFESISIESDVTKYSLGWSDKRNAWYLLDHIIVKADSGEYGFCHKELYDIDSLNDDTIVEFPFNYGNKMTSFKLSDERVLL